MAFTILVQVVNYPLVSDDVNTQADRSNYAYLCNTFLIQPLSISHSQAQYPSKIVINFLPARHTHTHYMLIHVTSSPRIIRRRKLGFRMRSVAVLLPSRWGLFAKALYPACTKTHAHTCLARDWLVFARAKSIINASQ